MKIYPEKNKADRLPDEKPCNFRSTSKQARFACFERTPGMNMSRNDGYLEIANRTGILKNLLSVAVKAGLPANSKKPIKSSQPASDDANFYSHSGRDDPTLHNLFSIEGNL